MATETLHGTAVAHNGFGCLILGAPGTGKTRLAADMIQRGARLISDDQIVLSLQSGMLMAAAPAPLSGVLHLRGLGIIKINDPIPRHVIHLAIELSVGADDPLPTPEMRQFLGQNLPVVKTNDITASQLMLYMRAMQEGRILPADWRPAA